MCLCRYLFFLRISDIRFGIYQNAVLCLEFFLFLQRSSSVPESQLSPSYGGQLLNNSNAQISPGGQRLNQQPYSPHSQLASPQQTFNNFPSTGNASGQARLSPHPPSFQQSQLSPRVSQVSFCFFFVRPTSYQPQCLITCSYTFRVNNQVIPSFRKHRVSRHKRVPGRSRMSIGLVFSSSKILC